ncbi:uncharacterized protein B0H18DRAFT_1117878 [Fomitopsis serialis]|uniref:uncharacterized protein n=1 Tax=Fomitopsis serialis TaxID=139415 RepID=UPI00200739E1|nr:uncharacterized protein B0H18DRAFT_1117878 [Neoantrodia serialis]KAH9928693.1 hypothetical protein B0H18DRAFT_1117878 [Neoantrodia serialis]
MSSKRGRKRNDNLPPNRARDVQRAFRARRAAHLEALESRVTELEEENNNLRAALNLPPANRMPLGKGPTGKDRPKSLSQPQQSNTASQPGSSTLPPIQFLPQVSPTNSLPSMPVSRHDSPSSASTRTHSLSPTAFNPSLGQAGPMSGMDSSPWDSSAYMGKDQPEPGPSSTSNSYTIPPVPGPSTSHSSAYASSTSRQSLDESYVPLTSYQYSPERSMASDPYSGITGSGFLLRDERRPFTYQQPSFPTHAGQLHAHSSPVSAVSPSMPSGGGQHIHSPYAHRRSATEPQGYRSNIQLGSIPQMRAPQPPNLPNRLPSPNQLSGAGGAPPPLHPGYEYGDERKLDRLR